MYIANLVSIIMPCFRAEKTLELAVSGIQSQHHPYWELLLVVDGIQDNCAALAQKLAASEPRIKLVLSTKNRGVARARNVGIRLAQGEWLAFCDADDFWEAPKLAAQLELAKESKANLICSTFWYWYPHRTLKSTQLVRLPKQLKYHTMLRTNAIPMSTALYHLPSLGKHYFKPLPAAYIHEDYAYWLRIMQHPAVQAQTLLLPTTFIRIQANSRSANKMLAMRSHAFILKTVAQLTFLKRCQAMLAYVSWGFRKRWSLQKAKESPVPPSLPTQMLQP